LNGFVIVVIHHDVERFGYFFPICVVISKVRENNINNGTYQMENKESVPWNIARLFDCYVDSNVNKNILYNENIAKIIDLNEAFIVLNQYAKECERSETIQIYKLSLGYDNSNNITDNDGNFSKTIIK